MTTTPRAESLPDGRSLHRRHRNHAIIAPLVLLTVIVAIGLIAMIIALRPHQIAVVANCLSALILMPLVLLCFIPQVLLFGLIVGTNWLHLKSGLVLTKATEYALRGRIITLRAATFIAKPVMRFSQAYSGAEAALRRARAPRRSLPALPAPESHASTDTSDAHE